MKKISSKPYKQWCKKRKIDFITWITNFPYVKLGLEKEKK